MSKKREYIDVVPLEDIDSAKLIEGGIKTLAKVVINDYHRLTEKEYDGYKLIKFFPGNTGDLAIYKLGLLEDLLEKYGITYWHELEHLIKLANKYEELDVEKKLKALEIIKRDCPNITLLLTCKNYARYLVMSGDNLLKEDYDFLREVLL